MPVTIGRYAENNPAFAPAQTDADEVDNKIVGKIRKGQFEGKGEDKKDVGSFEALGRIDGG